MQEPLLETWKSGFGLGIFLGTILISIIEQLWSEPWCFKITEKCLTLQRCERSKKVIKMPNIINFDKLQIRLNRQVNFNRTIKLVEKARI